MELEIIFSFVIYVIAPMMVCTLVGVAKVFVDLVRNSAKLTIVVDNLDKKVETLPKRVGVLEQKVSVLEAKQ